jgi:hypothetical protein
VVSAPDDNAAGRLGAEGRQEDFGYPTLGCTAMSTMSEWIAAVSAELELDLADPKATTTRVLDLTADVAHGVARPAAPVTAYLVGLAAGRAADPEAATSALVTRLGELAKAWQSQERAE